MTYLAISLITIGTMLVIVETIWYACELIAEDIFQGNDSIGPWR